MDPLDLMQPSGGIAEKLGEIADGRYPPPNRKEAYQMAQASIIQKIG